MKKIIITLVFLIISINNTNSYYLLNKNDKIIENKLSYVISKNIENKNLIYRDKLSQKLENIASINQKYYKIIQNVKINNYLYNYLDEQKSELNKINIDYQNIKDYWIELHNIERDKLELKNIYSNKYLDNTAYQWSLEQYKIWEMTHKRTNSNENYNHKDIEKWFKIRWINCYNKWWVSVSESIAKYSFYCQNSNCEQELKKSMKKIFDIYMSEKWLDYPMDAHYRAIIHPNISQIWIWIKLQKTNNKNFYEYYITSHYCSELIK